MSASGEFVPPMFIFPRKKMKDELMENAPPGAIASTHESGWMQSDLFVKWFAHFKRHANPTKERPVLLILDGHKTHTNNLSFLETARKNNVTILCLPSHCSHRVQPLDVSFLRPLMTYYTQSVENWLRNHLGRVVTTFQTAAQFRSAYLRAATMLTAVNGFLKTGIWPVDRHAVDRDFAAAASTHNALMWVHMQQAMERLLKQFHKRTETRSHIQRLQLVLPRHHETLFSMELGWMWHKFPDVAVWHRMLPMTYAGPSGCQHGRGSTSRCQRYGTSTAYSRPHHDLFPKWPDIQLYYYAESIRKGTGAEEETSSKSANDEPRPNTSGQAGSRLKPIRHISTKSTSEDATPCLYCCELFQTVKVARSG